MPHFPLPASFGAGEEQRWLFSSPCTTSIKGQDDSVITCKGLAPLRRCSLKPVSLASAKHWNADNPTHRSCPTELWAAAASRAQMSCSSAHSGVLLPNPRTTSSHTSETLRVVVSAKQNSSTNNTPILSRTVKSDQHSQPCSRWYQNIYNLSVLPRELKFNLGSCFLLTFLSPNTVVSYH